MIRIKGSRAHMILAMLLAWNTAVAASAEEWEVKIVATTPNGAENSLYFGQKLDATDGYDSRYEVRAMLGGDIRAYFPHAEWGVLAQKFWRDVKAPDQHKSWLFEVTTPLTGTEIMLKWDPLQLPEGYTFELIDMTQQTVIDMTSHNGYYFNAYNEPRQFAINTAAPIMAEFLNSPSGLDGAWVDNDTAIQLIWNDNSDGESGFMLERKAQGEPWTVIAWLKANTTTYSDYYLAPRAEKKKNNNVLFLYRVKAYNSLTESDYSNTKPIK